MTQLISEIGHKKLHSLYQGLLECSLLGYSLWKSSHQAMRSQSYQERCHIRVALWLTPQLNSQLTDSIHWAILDIPAQSNPQVTAASQHSRHPRAEEPPSQPTSWQITGNIYICTLIHNIHICASVFICIEILKLKDIEPLNPAPQVHFSLPLSLFLIYFSISKKPSSYHLKYIYEGGVKMAEE